MSWIQTYSGKQFWPLAPRAEDFDIEDIAHSLSMQCRFNGHCKAFYSVADHCVRVSRLVPHEDAMWGLLHDAGEAYLADLPRPLKLEMPSYQELEEQLLKVFARAFSLPWPIPASIKAADDIMLATEKRDLMESPPVSWGLDAIPHGDTITPLSPMAAKHAFLARYIELKER